MQNSTGLFQSHYIVYFIRGTVLMHFNGFG